MEKNYIDVVDWAKARYIVPQCQVIEMEKLQIICSTVRPNGESSRIDDYDEDTEEDGGDIDIWI